MGLKFGVKCHFNRSRKKYKEVKVEKLKIDIGQMWILLFHSVKFRYVPNEFPSCECWVIKVRNLIKKSDPNQRNPNQKNANQSNPNQRNPKIL